MESGIVNVGLSALFLRPNMRDGTRHMVQNLLTGLGQTIQEPDSLSVFANYNDAEIRRHTVTSDRLKVVAVRHNRTSNRFLKDTMLLRNQGSAYQVMLFPTYFAPPIQSKARVITVFHDLQHRHFPEFFPLRRRLWLTGAEQFALRRSDMIVAISHFVRDDILEQYGNSFADKIVVLPNPISWSRFSVPIDDYPALCGEDREKLLVLSIASHYPHKNLATLLQAFKLLLAQLPNARLVLVGTISKDLANIANATDISGLVRDLDLTSAVTVTGHVSDSVLGGLYRRTALVVIPSLFEGFGMPAVEALGMGLPVLTTRCGALPEVTLGKAQYLSDPLDAEEMATAMQSMLCNRWEFVPSPEMVASVRSRYAADEVANQYLGLSRSLGDPEK